MEIQIDNVLNFLKLVKKFQNDGKEYVISSYNHEPTKRGAFPNHSELEEFCSRLGVLNVNSKSFELTVIGERILQSLDKDAIKEILISECFLKGNISKNILQDISQFSIDDNKTRWCKKKDFGKLFMEKKALWILYETGFLQRPDGIVTINQKFMPALNNELKKVVRKKPPKSQAQLEKELERERENKKKIGEIAENRILEFEKEQSRKARRISQENASAGYDIESQDEDGNVRLIEVKGSTGDEFDIYWSQNEIKTARENRDKYWLYFVPGVDIKSEELPEPELYPDPIASILDSNQFTDIKEETLHLIKNKSEEN